MFLKVSAPIKKYAKDMNSVQRRRKQMNKKNYEGLELKLVQFVQEDVLTASNEKGVSWMDDWNGNWGDDWSNFVC